MDRRERESATRSLDHPDVGRSSDGCRQAVGTTVRGELYVGHCKGEQAFQGGAQTREYKERPSILA